MPHTHGSGSQKVVQNAPRISAEMNVTPLIDVLLVLLVIFMAALPLVQRGLDADLPHAAAPRTQAPAPAQIVLEIDGRGAVAVNHQPVERHRLGVFLRDVYAARRDKTLFVSGEPHLRYRDVMDVIDTARGAGVERVGIITDAMRRESAAPDVR